MSTEKSESPAELGDTVVSLAEAARARYRALGVLDWAEDQAKKDADESIRALKVFLQVHRLNIVPAEESLVGYFRNLWVAGLFVPLTKWVTSYFLASMAAAPSPTGPVIDLPPRPEFVPVAISPLNALFPGDKKLQQVLRCRLGEKKVDGGPKDRALHLAWSFLGLKAMFPPLWVDQVSKSLFDHSHLLSSTPPLLPKELRESLELVGDSAARLIYPTRTPVPYSSLPRPKLSSSAGWVKMYDHDSRRFRTMAGTRSAQYQTLQVHGIESPLFSMDYRPTVGVMEFRGHPYSFDWKDWDFDPKVSVVALQEPFKIRTISIADGPATAAASPLQKAWHSRLRQLRPFSLIGGARVADKVGEIFPFDGVPFVSGDYSAATDRLSLTASHVVFNSLMKPVALDPVLRSRIASSLFGAELDYSQTLAPFRDKVPKELLDSIPLPPPTQQTNGQLMGNILSFPLLCLVNMAGYIAAMRHSQTPTGGLIRDAFERGYLSEEDWNALPVLVNGDDILFQANWEDYSRWIALLPHLGLKPSVGKNYYTPDFFTINSELYTPKGFRSRPWWGAFTADVFRLRQELRFETGEDVLVADMRRVLPKMQEFLRETVDAQDWPNLNKLWVTHLKESGLVDAYTGLNWFLPVQHGGLGLDPAGHTVRYTYAQRKLAVRLSLDPDMAGRFLPGPEGTLINARSTKLLRDSTPSTYMAGELVSDGKGGKYVVDRSAPMRVRFVRDRAEVYMAVHATLDTHVSRSSHIDSWLEHHTDGVRLDADRVKQGVTRMLDWGLKVSDKRLVSFEGLDVRPRYRCVRKTTFLPVANLE